MTRQEIETYLLHAWAGPETFVLDEQADRLEAAIKREVIEARIEELDQLLAVHLHEKFTYENQYPVRAVPQAAIANRTLQLRAELAALDTEQQGGAERRYEPHTREELAEFARRASEFKVDVLKGLSALDSTEPQEPGQPAPEVKP